ncbi:hypothetical protein [Streptomyces flavidovirens]|uniref:hypothetical protein n=1 Tax=Streptomyces flavidovirens TaxID=67298 RepID=UPI0036BE1532
MATTEWTLTPQTLVCGFVHDFGFWLNFRDENALSDGWRMAPWLTRAAALVLRLLS